MAPFDEALDRAGRVLSMSPGVLSMTEGACQGNSMHLLAPADEKQYYPGSMLPAMGVLLGVVLRVTSGLVSISHIMPLVAVLRFLDQKANPVPVSEAALLI